MRRGTRQLLAAGIDETTLAAVQEVLADAGLDGMETASSGNEALLVLERHPYEAVVLGDRLQDMDVLECVRRIRRAHASPALIVVTDSSDPRFVDEVLAEGTDACVTGRATRGDVGAALRQTLRRTVYLANGTGR